MNEVILATLPSASFLTVGQAIKVSLTLNREKVMYGSTLLGWKDHAWLMCEWPAHLGNDAEIAQGTPCTVSYLYDGKLVGYRTDIRDRVTSPVPLLFLAFPQTVEAMHLRKHTRVPSCEPVLLMKADTHATSASPIPASDYSGGILLDVSAGGCSIALTVMPSWIRPGSTVRIEFELQGLGHVTNLTGVVKNADRRDDTNVIGLQFLFGRMEYIEYRGWGGSVQQAIEQCVLQKQGAVDPTSAR